MANPERNPSDSLPGTGTTQTQRGAAATQGEGEHLTDRARRKAGELAGELKQKAEDSAEDMRRRAISAVDQQKDAAVGGIEGVAQALRSASDDLRERGQPVAAEYSRQVADGLESMANWVNRRNLDDVVGSVEDFARQRPVAFIGGAVVAGFALARFMKSSSVRRSRMSEHEFRGATARSYRQPRRTEHTRASAAPDSSGQNRAKATSASAAAGGYGRPTEGGI
jgi:hypothetical protein